MIPNPYPGVFIVFEGIDGCGKTAQLNRIYGWLQTLEIAKHHDILKMKEPGKERFFGKRIYADLANKDPCALHKTDPFGFQKWYACDSKENLRQNVNPALEVGSIVLCDRFRPSMVYGAKGLGDVSTLMIMNQEIIGEDFIWPNFILIFDLPVNVAINRLKEKNRDLDEHEKHGVLNRVRHNYLHFASVYPNCKVVDSSSPEEAVFENVKKLVLPFLKSKELSI